MSGETNLKDFATSRQTEILNAVESEGSQHAAARKLGIHRTTVKEALQAVRKKAAMQGFAPEADLKHVVPAPLVLRGTSTLYDGDGKPRLQWVKTRLDESKAREAIEEWVGWLVQDAKGLAPLIAQPVHPLAADLLACYPMGDPHFGMYSWGEESGEDFDLGIAERLTYAAIDRLVASAPAAKTALILELGDFFHSDNNSARTERSGNALDVDTRWARVMKIGLRAMTYVIKAALAKHDNVVVRIVAGNHDDHSSYALALGLDAYFNNEPRVEIALSPANFWYYRHGKSLIGVTHGHTCKPEQLPAIMATDRKEDWGATDFRYWYHGHFHHKRVSEHPGCVVEGFNTLAARDAWHAGAGYRAGRDMQCIIHHKQYGEIERHRCDIAMLKEALT